MARVQVVEPVSATFCSGLLHLTSQIHQERDEEVPELLRNHERDDHANAGPEVGAEAA
jgi:hypothetical protein